jgi:hypothetical protein
MTAGATPNYECPSCRVPLFLADPGISRTIVCGSCGVVLDLSDGYGYVLGEVRPNHHGPEGLVEIGRRGRLGERRLIVVGRARYGNLHGADFKMFDVWNLLTEDGVWLRLFESQGDYALLVPVTGAVLPGAEDIATRSPGDEVDLGDGLRGIITSARRVRTIHLAGEHDDLVAPNDEVGIVELKGPASALRLLYGQEGGRLYAVQPVEDRAMWSIFQYTDILRAHDAVEAERSRAERAGRSVAGAGMMLLGSAFLGVLLTVALYSSSESVGEGWARFDFLPRQGRVEQPMGTATLGGPAGFYRLEGECGLDRTSRSLQIYALRPGGERIDLVDCQQRGAAASVRPFSVSFTDPQAETLRLFAVHEGNRELGGRAHARWTMTWTLGSIWWPLLGLASLVLAGVGLLAAWPFVRVGNLAKLQDAFDERRAELALALRRRGSGIVIGAQEPPTGGTS